MNYENTFSKNLIRVGRHDMDSTSMMAGIYGHSHTNIDAEINGTKVICNQMGYVFDNEHISNGFDSSKCLIL